MNSSSTTRLTQHLENLADTLRAVKNLPKQLPISLEQARKELETTSPVNPQEAENLRRAYNRLSLACNLKQAEDIEDPKLIDKAAKTLIEALHDANTLLGANIAGVFNLLSALKLPTEQAQLVIDQNQNAKYTKPVINSNLPSLAEMAADLEQAQPYCESSSFKRLATWIATPSIQQQANYILERALRQDFLSDDANQALVRILLKMEPNKLDEFMQQQIYQQAAKLDHYLMDFYYARLASQTRPSDEVVAECERRFDLNLDKLIPGELTMDESESDLSHSEKRRVVLSRSSTRPYSTTRDKIQSVAKTLQTYKWFANELRNESNITSLVGDLAHQRQAYWEQLFRDVDSESGSGLQLAKIDLNEVRDRLNLDSIFQSHSDQAID